MSVCTEMSLPGLEQRGREWKAALILLSLRSQAVTGVTWSMIWMGMVLLLRDLVSQEKTELHPCCWYFMASIHGTSKSWECWKVWEEL